MARARFPSTQECLAARRFAVPAPRRKDEAFARSPRPANQEESDRHASARHDQERDPSAEMLVEITRYQPALQSQRTPGRCDRIRTKQSKS